MATEQFDTLRFEKVIGRNLEDEERDRITLWEKGRHLQQMVSLPGWQVVLEMLQSYPVEALKEIVKIDPSLREEVISQHAIAFAGSRMFTLFQEDVAKAVEAAKHPPEFVREALIPRS